MSEALAARVRVLDPDRDGALVQQLIERDPDFARRVTGSQPGFADGRAVLTDLPPGVPAGRKIVIGLLGPDGVPPTGLIGVLDLIRGYPTSDRAFLCLLQLDPDHQGRGLAAALHDLALAVVRGWPEVRRVRLAVVRTNDRVVPFWTRPGYHRVPGLA